MGPLTVRRAAALSVVLAAGVLVHPPLSQTPDAGLDPEIARMAGEISPAEIRATVDALAGFGTRHSRSDTASAARGIGAARRWIEAHLSRSAQAPASRMTVELDAWEDENARIARTRFVNIMAIIPAAQPEAATRWYIAGGHYDSRNSDPKDAEGDAPGANDDASGTAVVLELARVLAARRLDANLLLVAFDGEEHGLIGSRRLAALAPQRGWQVAGMITNDIVGGTLGGNGVQDSTTIRCFSGGSREPGGADSSSREWARYLRTQAERYDLSARIRMVFRIDRFGRGGDHIPFHEAGWPALRLTEAAEDYTRQHQNVRTESGVSYGDVPGMVSADYVARVARANLAALVSAALAPAPPSDLKIAGAVTQDTVLTWKRGLEPDLAGYAIYMRETTEPMWERRIWAGAVESFTLKGISIDNSFFGVAAVDTSGHESPVALPTRG